MCVRLTQKVKGAKSLYLLRAAHELRAKHHTQGSDKATAHSHYQTHALLHQKGHRKRTKPEHRAGTFYNSTCGFGLRQLPKE